jgi:hypothetical protein
MSVHVKLNEKISLPLDADEVATIADLKMHLASLKGMTENRNIDCNLLTIQLDGKNLSDEVEIKSLANDSCLSIKFDSSMDLSSLEKDCVDVTHLTQRFRDITREELPSTRHRHLIQEHQRRVTAAVVDAMNRSRKSSEALITIEKTIPEDSSVGESFTFDDIRNACEPLIRLIESEDTVTVDCACVAASDFVDGLVSSDSFSIFEDDCGVHESLETVLSMRPIDRLKLARIFASLCHFSHETTEVLSESPRAAADTLATLVASKADAGQLARGFRTLIKTLIRNGLRSPTSGRGLLPNPAEKASLSPELVRWAQGLKPKHKGSM